MNGLPFREEGRKEKRKEGRKEGRKKGVLTLEGNFFFLLSLKKGKPLVRSFQDDVKEEEDDRE